MMLLIIVASANSAVETYAQGATQAATGAATAAATVPPASAFSLCLPPPPTPGATEAAPAATAAATAAAPAPTAVAAATQAATQAATRRPPNTPRPTVIPKGRRPAVAGITLARDATVVRTEGQCLRVVDVQRGGPGAAAGIKRGDYILGFDANVLARLEDFNLEQRKHVSGDVVTLTVQSGQQANQIKVTLGLGR
jgi:pyruvate/2-oxoglutarate dehydrogenase complex dihydrolipoamide acyltransferase (E2) component